MPKVRASSGTIGTTSSPISLSRSILASIRTNAIVVDALRPSLPLMEFAEQFGEGVGLERLDLNFAGRDEATELLAPLQHVSDFGAVVWWPVERRLGHLLVTNRDAESCSKRLQLVLIQLLLLVGDVLAFTRLADPVSLDRPRQNHRRLARRFDGGLVGRVDLDGIVSAEGQLLELFVRQVLDHLEQLRVGSPEVLANVLAGLDGVFLILAVDDFSHALDEEPVVILRRAVRPTRCPRSP